MDRFLVDLRSSLRILRRSPGLALSAVAALAMGIGFTTTMFSIVHGATRDLPFPDPEELVVLTRTVPRGGYDLDPGTFDYVEWTRQQRSFAGLAAFEANSMNLAGDARRPDRRSGAAVTPGAFELLGELPLLGRGLLPDDATPGAPAVVVVGYDLWRARFDADSNVLGRVVRVDGESRTVVGVMRPRFGFPVNSDLWIPLVVDADPQPSAQGSGLKVFGRLRDGVEIDEARAELATIADRLARQYPETHEGQSARAYPFVEVEMAENTAAILYLMLGIVSFVLLIACANVANLLLARAALRTREVAIRTALGASRWRIVAQHVSESVVLAALGGLLGLGVAHVAVRFFAVSTANIIEAFWIDFRVDGAVVLFATALVALAGLLAGILPGLRASAANVAELLKDAGGSTGLRMGRLARSLVVVEVALATGFLILTMTFTQTAVALRAVPMPFAAEELFTGQIGLSQETMGSPDARGRLTLDLTARLEALPGVSGAALVSVLPGRGAGSWVFSLDAPATTPTPVPTTTGFAIVTPGFFDVLGAPVLRGRGLAWRDTPDAAPVVVVNESWVLRHSADRDPLGRRVWLGERMFEVVGVVPDLQMQDPEDRVGDGMYASLLQVRPYAVRLLLRTGGGDPLALTPTVRDAIEAVDPDLPLFEVATLSEAIYADKKVLEAFGALFLVFGAGALFLTTVGLYGVVSFAVSRRAREIGVRVALGARPRDVVRLVLRQGATLVALGTAIGLLIAFGLSQALASVMEVAEPAGWLTYLGIVVALGGTALVGLLRPVRRALALEPMTALRLE